MAKLRFSGAWVGVLEVELDQWTVSMLIDELAKRSNFALNTIKLISAGRVLKESPGDPNLAEIGIKNNAKVYVTRVEVDDSSSVSEAEKKRFASLLRVNILVDRMAKLDSKKGPVRDLLLEIDQSFAMIGLLLHSQGRQLIRRELYKEAIQVLALCEEAFYLCDPKFMKNISNVPILQLDMVWCYFMLGDARFIPDAVARLDQARKEIQLSYWEDPTTELSLHLRLELLEGIVAYHRGWVDESRMLLTSAQEKLRTLQVYNEALLLLKSMSYNETEAKISLDTGDPERAVKFILDEEEKQAEKHAENIQRKKETRFEHELVAEAVGRNESDTHKSLSNLSNPELNSKLQPVATRRSKQDQEKEAIIAELVYMGFKSRVISIMRDSRSQQEAMDKVISSLQELGCQELSLEVSRIFSCNLADEGTSNEERVQEEDILLWIDYDTDFTKAAEAINEYLAWLDSSYSYSWCRRS